MGCRSPRDWIPVDHPVDPSVVVWKGEVYNLGLSLGHDVPGDYIFVYREVSSLVLADDAVVGVDVDPTLPADPPKDVVVDEPLRKKTAVEKEEATEHPKDEKPQGEKDDMTITTINSVSQSVPLLTTTQAETALTADYSTNPNYAFDGMLTWAFKPASNAYVNTFATGTAGVGTVLTSSGDGSVNEIDVMMQQMWNISLLSPTVGYVNSQELRNITNKTLNGASAPLLRYFTETDTEGTAEYKLTAAGVVAFYFNPYTPDGGVKIPINIHPNLAPGTTLWWAEHLPPWYVSNSVPETAVIQTRQDYYAEVWPKTTRAQYYGVYSQEALAVYVPFAMGVLNNIGNG
jgi:hypothetical protein